VATFIRVHEIVGSGGEAQLICVNIDLVRFIKEVDPSRKEFGCCLNFSDEKSVTVRETIEAIMFLVPVGQQVTDLIPSG
jgi:hypothetical protein